MFSSPFPGLKREEPGNIAIADTSSTFSYTSLQDCSRHCTLKWKKDMSVEAEKSLINDNFAEN